VRGALEYLQMQTASRAGNQVYVDPEVVAAAFATKEVEPPNDYMASVPLVRTLLQGATAQKKVDVCLEPEGGFRLKLARSQP